MAVTKLAQNKQGSQTPITLVQTCHVASNLECKQLRMQATAAPHYKLGQPIVYNSKM